ncbi:MAG: hypothetical protein ABDH28_04880, partial [Brevinematia bacterium]
MMEIFAILVLVVVVILLVLRREILYSLVTIVVFLVALPLVLTFDTVVSKAPSIVLHLDYSESSKDEVKKVEPYLVSLGFDFVRKFGETYNKPSDFSQFQDENSFHVIVSDFLFDIPESIVSNT